MKELYYEAPDQEIFDEVKSKAILLWATRYPEDKHPFYAQEKIASIQNLENVKDNMMYIVAMFDWPNQQGLATMLSPNTRQAIKLRMIDGGQPIEYIAF